MIIDWLFDVVKKGEVLCEFWIFEINSLRILVNLQCYPSINQSFTCLTLVLTSEWGVSID